MASGRAMTKGVASALVIVLCAGCGGANSSRNDAKSLDGVYRMTTSFGDASSDPSPVAENYGDWIFVFDGGRFAFTQAYRDACTWGYGKLALKGDELDWTILDGGGIAPNAAVNKPGEQFRFRWTRYRDTLALRAVKGTSLPEDEISPLNFRLRPWHVVSTTPSRRYFSKRCPPPTAALR
jgi:hypothetical protein